MNGRVLQADDDQTPSQRTQRQTYEFRMIFIELIQIFPCHVESKTIDVRKVRILHKVLVDFWHIVEQIFVVGAQWHSLQRAILAQTAAADV